MDRARFIGLMIVMIAVMGFIGSELGLTQQQLTALEIEKPESGGGFWDNLNNILAPFIIIWDLLVSYFQLALYQAQGVPSVVNLVIITPLNFAMGWLIVKAIRGG